MDERTSPPSRAARREMATDRRVPADGRMDQTGRGEPAVAGLLPFVALVCPLLCLTPLLLASLAATGFVRAVQGAPWPLVLAVLALLALGLWGLRARRTRAYAVPPSLPRDGTTSHD